MSKLEDFVGNLFPNFIAAINPLVHRCGGEIEHIAGFKIASDEEKPFIAFIEWINSKPDFIESWRSSEATEQGKYLPFMNGIENARNAFRATRYHLENLRKIENEISSVLNHYDLSAAVPKGAVMALGEPRKWDYEYQAFVLQYRLSLEYFTIGIGIYFGIKTKQFPKFHNALFENNDNPVAIAIEPIWADALQRFRFMRDIRNELVHDNAVSAACINVTAKGLQYVGGGEQMGILDRDDKRGLADRLEQRVQELHNFLGECLGEFEGAVKSHEVKPTPTA